MTHSKLAAIAAGKKKWETPDFYIIDTNPNSGHNAGAHEKNYINSSADAPSGYKLNTAVGFVHKNHSLAFYTS
jgi:hypothetical protein